MKKTIAIILGIFLLSFASALFAGECKQVDLDFESYDNVTYFTIANKSNLDGLNISLVDNIVNICPALNYEPDNFTIVFIDNSIKEGEKEVVIQYRRSGSKTKYVDRNITEYVTVEKIVEVNKTIEVEKDCEVEEKLNFFQRIWNWIKNLFKKGE